MPGNGFLMKQPETLMSSVRKYSNLVLPCINFINPQALKKIQQGN